MGWTIISLLFVFAFVLLFICTDFFYLLLVDPGSDAYSQLILVVNFCFITLFFSNITLVVTLGQFLSFPGIFGLRRMEEKEWRLTNTYQRKCLNEIFLPFFSMFLNSNTFLEFTCIAHTSENGSGNLFLSTSAVEPNFN